MMRMDGTMWQRFEGVEGTGKSWLELEGVVVEKTELEIHWLKLQERGW